MTRTARDADGLRGTRLGHADRGVIEPAPALPPCGTAPRVEPMHMLRLEQVLKMTGLGKTTIYELQKDGRFPMGVAMTAHSVRWVEEEVQAWLRQRAQARGFAREVVCNAAHGKERHL